MKKTPSRKSRRENWENFADGNDDITIAPYLSSAEVCRRFAPSKKKKGAAVDDSDDFFDATDLMNKGADDYRRQRRAAKAQKGRGRNAGTASNAASSADVAVDINKGGKKSEKISSADGASSKTGKFDKSRKNARSNASTAPVETPEPRKRSKRNKNVGSEPGDRGDSVGLRVVGGLFRGTKLEYGGDRRVRPMKERVREAIFNLLGQDVRGKHVVDLFGGTGALTFEAISRGALSATTIEIHFPTARIARRNIEILEEKIPGTAAKIELTTTDTYFWGRKLAATDPNAPAPKSPVESLSQATLPNDVPWLVFCSPPYDFFVDREGETLELLQTLRERAPEGSIFVVESDDRFDFDLLEVEIPPKKRRSYPPAEVGIFRV
ncbi:MAG: RsmD family RNA methyltransferase [Thermoguttaceae bacterium]|nr:RsmD family RNA methyltransferase [Thermoguttaceae bacterium]